MSRALVNAGASPTAAQSTASALVYADQQGTASHGVSRVPQYAGHMKASRIDGKAVPASGQPAPAETVFPLPTPAVFRVAGHNQDFEAGSEGPRGASISPVPLSKSCTG